MLESVGWVELVLGGGGGGAVFELPPIFEDEGEEDEAGFCVKLLVGVMTLLPPLGGGQGGGLLSSAGTGALSLSMIIPVPPGVLFWGDADENSFSVVLCCLGMAGPKTFLGLP